MHSATAVGFTMVGRQSHQPDPADSFRPKTVHSDSQREKQREMYYKAIRTLTEKMKGLLEDATEPDEIRFWKQTLDQLKGS